MRIACVKVLEKQVLVRPGIALGIVRHDGFPKFLFHNFFGNTFIFNPNGLVLLTQFKLKNTLLITKEN